MRSTPSRTKVPLPAAATAAVRGPHRGTRIPEEELSAFDGELASAALDLEHVVVAILGDLEAELLEGVDHEADVVAIQKVQHLGLALRKGGEKQDAVGHGLGAR